MLKVNLMNEIDMNVVAQMACTSTCNFQKMFSFIKVDKISSLFYLNEINQYQHFSKT